MGRNIYKKLTALILAGLMVTGAGAGAFSCTVQAENGMDETVKESGGTGTTDSKEEVIYALLGADGGLQETYVVNILNVTSPGLITDIGNYDELKNLTSTSEMKAENGTISVNAEAGRFYYQGTLKKAELPWEIQMDYMLDGKQVRPEDLGGAEGHLKVRIRTFVNENLDRSFYEHYMLQIAVTLDSASCTDIVAEGATTANAGSDKLLTFTVMPETDGDITVEADVEDFEMTGISFTAVPFSMDSFNLDLEGIDEMVEGIGSLSEAIEQLNDGVRKLEQGGIALGSGVSDLTDGVSLLAEGMDGLHTGTTGLTGGAAQVAQGAAGLAEGAAELESGSETFRSGLRMLSGNSAEIISGSAQVWSALKYISRSLSGADGELDLSALSELPGGLRAMGTGIGELQGGLSELSAGYEAVYNTMDGLISGIPAATGAVNQNTTAGLYAAVQGDDSLTGALAELIAVYEPAQILKGTWNQAAAGFKELNDSLAELPEKAGAVTGSLNATADLVEAAVAETGGTELLSQLTGEIDELAESYGVFHKGLQEYTGGVDELASGYKELDHGIKTVAAGMDGLTVGTGQLADAVGQLAAGTDELSVAGKQLAGGSSELKSGTTELADSITELAGGTGELHDGTKELPQQADNAMEGMSGLLGSSDFTPVSFISSQNTDIAEVQFVIQAAGIQRPEAEVDVIMEEEKETIWTRFLDLFSF